MGSLIAIALLTFAHHSEAQDPIVDIQFSYELQVGCLGSSAKVYAGYPRGDSYILRMYVSSSSGFFEVRFVEQLQEIARITSPQEALQYVRLLDSPATYDLFQNETRPVEIILRENLKVGDVFGNAKLFSEMRRTPLRRGILPRRLQFEGYLPATAARKGTAFLIRRWLICGKAQDHALTLVEETVSPKGAIAKSILKKVKLKPSDPLNLLTKSAL